MGGDVVTARGPDHVSFGHFSLDRAQRRLSRHGDPVALEPQVFDVLSVLVSNRSRVVTKEELLDAVWGDRFVSPATLTSRVRDLRAALDDTGRAQHTIRTVHGRGFQFVADVDGDAGSGFTSRSPDATSAVTTHASGVVVTRPTNEILGRRDELAALTSALEEHRLVSVVGPGGVGKTHLARHAAADGTDPVWFCDLSSVREAVLLPVACLEAVGGALAPGLDPMDSLIDALDASSSSLLVDNCEHLIDDVAWFVKHLTTRRPSVRVLATSRRPLGLSGEHVMRLEPLDAERSVELFVRAAARQGIEIDTRSPVLARICERLDGLPLAVELAASRARALPLEQIERLLDDRFTVLTTAIRDDPVHHFSLVAALGWSFDLLSPDRRAVLRQMSAFVGSFDIDDAIAVCADSGDDVVIAEAVIDLVDQSLVVFDAASGRYHLLESIRLFAAQDDDDVAGARARHAAHFLEVVEQSAATLVGPDIDGAFRTLRLSWPEIRAAESELVATDRSRAARLIVGVAPFAEMSYAFEVIDWIDDVVTATPSEVDPVTVGRLAAIRSTLLSHAGQFEQAAQSLAAAAAAEGSSDFDLASFWAAYFTGDVATAQQALDRIFDRHRDAMDYHEALGLTLQHYLAKGADEPVDDAVLRRLQRFGEHSGEIGRIANDLCAAVRRDWGSDPDGVLAALADLIARGRRLGFRLLVGGASTARSVIIGLYGGTERGPGALRVSLQTYADDLMWSFAMADLGAAALTLARAGDAEHAAVLLGARAVSGYRGDVSEEAAASADRVSREALGDRFESLYAEGARQSARAATRLAIERLTLLEEQRTEHRIERPTARRSGPI